MTTKIPAGGRISLARSGRKRSELQGLRDHFVRNPERRILFGAGFVALLGVLLLLYWLFFTGQESGRPSEDSGPETAIGPLPALPASPWGPESGESVTGSGSPGDGEAAGGKDTALAGPARPGSPLDSGGHEYPPRGEDGGEKPFESVIQPSSSQGPAARVSPESGLTGSAPATESVAPAVSPGTMKQASGKDVADSAESPTSPGKKSSKPAADTARTAPPGRQSPRQPSRQQTADAEPKGARAEPERETASPPAKPSPPQPASLMIQSNIPDARVYVDEKELGVPGSSYALDAGEYQIRVEKPGFAPFRTRIRLEAAQTKNLNAQLQPLPAKLSLQANVSGGRLYIDNRLVGKIDAEPLSLSPGKHTIRLEKKLFLPLEKEIELARGEERAMRVTLQPEPGELAVEANIPESAVFIDKKPAAAFGSAPYRLPPGKHTLRVENQGYRPYEIAIDISPGEKKAVDVWLIRRLPAPGGTLRDPLKDAEPGPAMVVIPAGEFLMGSPAGENGRLEQEGPRRQVRIPRNFALGQTEVTVGQFRTFFEKTGYRTEAERGRGCRSQVGSSWKRIQENNWRKPGFPQGEDHPVACVSWRDATVYTEWLTEQTGERYRLPTEAEWEYAARAGTDTPFSLGNCLSTDQANYYGKVDYGSCRTRTGQSREKSVPARTFPANPWGLYEVHGNVWEWTEDCWHETYQDAPANGAPWGTKSGGDCSRRVVRGGAWYSPPVNLRSATRYRNAVNATLGNVGFRLARAPCPPPVPCQGKAVRVESKLANEQGCASHGCIR
uniref:Formylglycine-generating enzyme, required for sulfatase activity, contains SUMF1/FGE domain n=1 Tax=Candidatus Kentrum sp. DK TaxID=2126562 RepID=A0A450SAE2_9GAMM|nr:MAG: Formylglycine-generating enzyme, required for sulfatase activity, contains SUMF1/FGE domain [Candidatus Kentron sp. DK]